MFYEETAKLDKIRREVEYYHKLKRECKHDVCALSSYLYDILSGAGFLRKDTIYFICEPEVGKYLEDYLDTKILYEEG